MTQQPVSNTDIRKQNEARSQERAFAVWLTGLPCSGKTTLAKALQQKFTEQHITTHLLDGDDLRKGLNKDLGYSIADRTENIRRAAEATKLLTDAGVVTLSCFITPSEELRKLVLGILGKQN